MIFHCSPIASLMFYATAVLVRYYSVYKISTLFWNSTQINVRNFSLLWQHLLSYCFPISPCIGSLSNYQFVGYDSNCIQISAEWMILSEKYLRRHIARCSTGLMRVLRLPISSNAKISNPYISWLIQNNILRFHIPVNDVPLMQMVESFY